MIERLRFAFSITVGISLCKVFANLMAVSGMTPLNRPVKDLSLAAAAKTRLSSPQAHEEVPTVLGMGMPGTKSLANVILLPVLKRTSSLPPSSACPLHLFDLNGTKFVYIPQTCRNTRSFTE